MKKVHEQTGKMLLVEHAPRIMQYPYTSPVVDFQDQFLMPLAH